MCNVNYIFFPKIDSDIQLSIGRGKISSTKCSFPSCSTEIGLRRMPMVLRAKILKDKRIFIAAAGKVCLVHIEENAWAVVENCQLLHSFTGSHIEEMVDLLRKSQSRGHVIEGTEYLTSVYVKLKLIVIILLLSTDTLKRSAHDVQRDTGLTVDQYNDLLQCLPSLKKSYSNPKAAADSLYCYLMKMRTAQPNEDIARYFGVSQTTIYRRYRIVRECFEKDFVSNHINYLQTHEQLAEHTTAACRILHCENDIDRAAMICDGTYIYTHKSKNFEFQKKTYTDQKKRNFVKIMMCVGCDGFIFFALGPYPASLNDAKILQTIFDASNTFNNLRPNDIFILDRGFRDCVNFVREKNMVVKMPNLIQRTKNINKKQLTTYEANQSRLVTAVRFVVETRNGHMKTVWKIFDMVWGTVPLQHLMVDFRICGAILNKYHRTFQANAGIAEEIANRMLDRLNVPNTLTSFVNKAPFQRAFNQFVQFNAFQELPTLHIRDLIWVSLGRYQINNAASYCQQHCKQNNSEFMIFQAPNDVCKEYLEKFITQGKSPILLMARLKSRYSSAKKHDAYVLIDKKGEKDDSVLEYCCSCYIGLRTIGCCSHVMCIIYFALCIKVEENLHMPAKFIDNFFDITYDFDYENE